jgi:AraC-like DNA-binding protein
MYELKTTQYLPKSQKLDFFRDLISETFFPMRIEDNRKRRDIFSGQLGTRSLSQLGLAVIESTPVDVFRTIDQIASVTDDIYLIKIQVQGNSLIKHRGHEAHLKPGDFCICLSSEPYSLHFEQDYSQIVLSIPAALMQERVAQPQQHLGISMSSDIGANGLFSQFITMIGARLDSFDGVLAQRLEVNALDLLNITLEHSSDARRHTFFDAGVKTEYLHRIKSFIRSHIANENLTPAQIAKHHGISTRYLHMLFEHEDESVSRYIQKLRLELCRAAITDPASSSYTIAEIAYRFGFNDASHFSRTFSARFGKSPASYRRIKGQN